MDLKRRNILEKRKDGGGELGVSVIDGVTEAASERPVGDLE